jgi:pimeloyl-ACP methyl ester carboxylesterase
MQPMEETTSADGTRIAFDRSGQGPALILVGGALSDRAAAVGLAAKLAAHFTVIAPDRRGRGDSGDTTPYAVEREVEDIHALIGEAGGSAFVFGHSSGAVLALEVARTFPERVPKLAVYEPPFIVDDSRASLPADYVAQLETMVSEGRRGDAVAYFLTTGPGVPAEAVESMRGEEYWPSLEAVAHTLAYDGAVMGDTMSGSPAPLERWASLAVPTLVMDGGASPPWQHAAAAALASVLPDARHRTLADQDHGPADEILAPVLEEFFVG